VKALNPPTRQQIQGAAILLGLALLWTAWRLWRLASS
jgi:hypothetical protein